MKKIQLSTAISWMVSFKHLWFSQICVTFYFTSEDTHYFSFHMMRKGIFKMLFISKLNPCMSMIAGAGNLLFKEESLTIWFLFLFCRDSQQDIFNIFGSMFCAIIFFGINNCSTVLPFVATERTVLYREKFAGMFSSWAYSFAQVLHFST